MLTRAVVLAGLVVFFGAGCKYKIDKYEFGVKLEQVRVVDYGNGVYYFPWTGARFSQELSIFLAKHPKFKVVSITDDWSYLGTKPRVRGYFVVFQPLNN